MNLIEPEFTACIVVGDHNKIFSTLTGAYIFNMTFKSLTFSLCIHSIKQDFALMYGQ